MLWFHVGVPLSQICLSIFSFPDNNLSKYEWIFSELGMCIDSVGIWFGNANGQISLIFDKVVCPRHIHIFLFERLLEKISVDFTKLCMCIDIVEILFGIDNGQISSIFDRVICPRHNNGRVISFHVIFMLILVFSPISYSL